MIFWQHEANPNQSPKPHISPMLKAILFWNPFWPVEILAAHMDSSHHTSFSFVQLVKVLSSHYLRQGAVQMRRVQKFIWVQGNWGEAKGSGKLFIAKCPLKNYILSMWNIIQHPYSVILCKAFLNWTLQLWCRAFWILQILHTSNISC